MGVGFLGKAECSLIAGLRVITSVFMGDPELLCLLCGGSLGGVFLGMVCRKIGGGVEAIWE